MELATAQVHGMGNNLYVTYGDDKGLLVEFVEDAVHQPFESEKAGRAIFKQTPFLSIIFPGDKTKKTYRPATEDDKHRFALQWAAYEKGEKAIENGTPITQWNYLSKSQALELKHMGFWTVELLANATDTAIAGLIGGNAIRAQAQTFLAATKDDSKFTAMTAENEKLKAQINGQNDIIETLKARLDALEKSKTTLKLKGE